MTISDFIIRIVASVIFGFLIGFERQLTGHPAGIRTNALVSLGSSIFVIFSLIMETNDQTRVAGQIVTGVGFLCSGIIFKDGVSVRGLNTAATIWCTAAIGVLTSSGYILYATLATALLITVNVIFRPISNKINPIFDETGKCYQIMAVCDEDKRTLIRSIIMNHISSLRLILIDLESRDIEGGKSKVIAKMNIYGNHRDEIAETLINKIRSEEHVTSVGWEIL
ncbi:MAG: MgtC/SapB family protein [Fibromonadales bacterium]|nr:MgtC/SapB family protein [Fibromonadales bacterium]